MMRDELSDNAGKLLYQKDYLTVCIIFYIVYLRATVRKVVYEQDERVQYSTCASRRFYLYIYTKLSVAAS